MCIFRYDIFEPPFSAPFSWGTQKQGLLLPKQEAAFWEGTNAVEGGTKKEDAKRRRLQD
jgi:hypothetical protein